MEDLNAGCTKLGPSMDRVPALPPPVGDLTLTEASLVGDEGCWQREHALFFCAGTTASDTPIGERDQIP